jgi:hypothetical protein
VLTIAADPKHMGAIIGITAVLHTWGSTMMHHPHVHMIVPSGGISHDGQRWIPCRRPRFILPVRMLAKLFRGPMLDKLVAAHAAGELQFFGRHAHLANARAFAAFLAPLRGKKWFVYTKEPFAGPKTVLAYISRYTHRAAISNSRLIALDEKGVTFKYKEYRVEGSGRYKTMTLATHEFIRRLLIHVLPKGFHRIRHYGLFANSSRVEAIARARELLGTPTANDRADYSASDQMQMKTSAPAVVPACSLSRDSSVAHACAIDPRRHAPSELIPRDYGPSVTPISRATCLVPISDRQR